MVGTSGEVFRCKGFIESEAFKRCKAELIPGPPREFDDRIEALIWQLNRDASAPRHSRPLPGKFTRVAVTDPVEGIKKLRLFFRPQPDGTGNCLLLWVEEVDEWEEDFPF